MDSNNTALRQSDGTYFSFAPPRTTQHSSLLVNTIELFGPRYAPGATILYLHDSTHNIAIHEQEQLLRLDLQALSSPLMPDLLLYHEKKQALFLINMVTSKGVITPTFKGNIEQLLVYHPIQRVYVSICFNKDDYKQHMTDVTWGTYVWLAQNPEHTIFHW